MAREGDVKNMWDPDIEEDVVAAEAQYDDLIEKGYTAYEVGKRGKAGKVMKKFNPNAGAIIMIPEIEGG
jgi:hypothetical protein